jgi:hypothetical protein
MLIDGAKRKIPIAMFIALPIRSTRWRWSGRTAMLSRVHDFRSKMREILHHNHDYYGMADKVNKDAWDFLKDKSLPSDSRYRNIEFVRPAESGKSAQE